MDFLARKPKRVVLAFLVVLALAYAWRYREAIQGLFRAHDDRPLNIPFDNGSVRDSAPASAASGPAPTALRPPGGFRKCSYGKTVVYTDRACPPGSKEVATQNGTVNVVDR